MNYWLTKLAESWLSRGPMAVSVVCRHRPLAAAVVHGGDTARRGECLRLLLIT
jgi:hypothetical protein